MRWTRGRLEDCLLSVVSANEAPWSLASTMRQMIVNRLMTSLAEIAFLGEGIWGTKVSRSRAGVSEACITASVVMACTLVLDRGGGDQDVSDSRQYFMWDDQDRRKSHLRDTPVQCLRLPTPTPPPSQVPAGTWQRAHSRTPPIESRREESLAFHRQMNSEIRSSLLCLADCALSPAILSLVERWPTCGLDDGWRNDTRTCAAAHLTHDPQLGSSRMVRGWTSRPVPTTFAMPHL